GAQTAVSGPTDTAAWRPPRPARSTRLGPTWCRCGGLGPVVTAATGSSVLGSARGNATATGVNPEHPARPTVPGSARVEGPDRRPDEPGSANAVLRWRVGSRDHGRYGLSIPGGERTGVRRNRNRRPDRPGGDPERRHGRRAAHAPDMADVPLTRPTW